MYGAGAFIKRRNPHQIKNRERYMLQGYSPSINIIFYVEFILLIF
jgi:hypothetical protein